MPLKPERLYFELGRLIAETPELAGGKISPQVQRWLTSAVALVKSTDSLPEALQLSVACANLDGPVRARNADTIISILDRLLVKAEANAPPEVRGSVLLIGGDLDAYMVMRQLLSTATRAVLLVEPDAAAKILADYAILAPSRLTVGLLADEAQCRPSLVDGARRWQQRFGDSRNLMVRLASANSLYERLILLDSGRAWALAVPFSDLAKKTRTTLVRMRPEEEARKIAMYAEIWEEAKPL